MFGNRKNKTEKTDGWFFTRSLLNEINELSEETEKESTEMPAEADPKRAVEKAPLKIIERSSRAVKEQGVPDPSDPKKKGQNLQSQFEEQQRELEQAKKDLADTHSRFSKVNQRLIDQKEHLVRENEQFREENRKIAKNLAQLAKGEKAVSQSQSEEIEKLKATLRKKKFELNDIVERSQERIDALNKKIRELKTYSKVLNEEKQKLIKTNARLTMALEKGATETAFSQEHPKDVGSILEAPNLSPGERKVDLSETDQQRYQRISELEKDVLDQKNKYEKLTVNYEELFQKVEKLQEIQLGKKKSKRRVP